ncbi:hypothetical protein TNCV_5117281 [Trichonephila clavipes]|nr:hypothetical protein TNCV_5117281 [Trichonephila clavipes]
MSNHKHTRHRQGLFYPGHWGTTTSTQANTSLPPPFGRPRKSKRYQNRSERCTLPNRFPEKTGEKTGDRWDDNLLSRREKRNHFGSSSSGRGLLINNPPLLLHFQHSRSSFARVSSASISAAADELRDCSNNPLREYNRIKRCGGEGWGSVRKSESSLPFFDGHARKGDYSTNRLSIFHEEVSLCISLLFRRYGIRDWICLEYSPHSHMRKARVRISACLNAPYRPQSVLMGAIFRNDFCDSENDCGFPHPASSE